MRTMYARKWTDQQLIDAVENSLSYRDIFKHLGIQGRGGSYPTIKRRIQELELSTAHLLGKHKFANKSRSMKHKLELSEILTEGSYYSSGNLRKRLLKDGLKENRCEECGISDSWQAKPLTLELHHINKIHTDNRLENLKILCPNCHAQM